MLNFKPILFAVLFVAVIFAGVFLQKKCSREKDPVATAKELRESTRQVLDLDSLNSATQAKLRAAVDSTVFEMEGRQKAAKTEYIYVRVKDEQAEKDYLAGKIECKEVIAAKNTSIRKGEMLLARCDSLRSQDSAKMKSYAVELEGKNESIRKLAENVDLAVKEIERRDNLKEPVKLYLTASAETNPVNYNASVGGMITTPKGFIFGYQKGLIQNSHEVRAGVQLRFGK